MRLSTVGLIVALATLACLASFFHSLASDPLSYPTVFWYLPVIGCFIVGVWVGTELRDRFADWQQARKAKARTPDEGQV